MSRQRNSAASKAWLARLEAEGRERATKAAQRRVLEATMAGEKAGLDRIEAAAQAMAAETGRTVDEARGWLLAQRQKVIDAKKRLEAQFVAIQAEKAGA